MAARTSKEERRLRPPPIRTSMERSHSGLEPTTPSSPYVQSPPRINSGHSEDYKIPDLKVPSTHQRFVLTDPVAFRYLEQDPNTTVLGRELELEGYETYVVEQWTTSRIHPTFSITTYTGDPNNKIVTSVLAVPSDEQAWSSRLRVYFKALNQYHAKRRETPLGILMVTSLSGFPSSLTVIAVPGGNLNKHRYVFFVNENLKRLGCSGRVGLSLGPPSAATIAKFHQLYRTSDKNDPHKAVIELVKMCQSALMLFDKLEVDYADGLLCDVTERAISDWWVEMGSEFYNVEPHDGILGPTTVAALLGLLMGARNRLHSAGAPVSKDPFDVDAMKRGTASFQKQQRLNRSRRLDRRTLDRLHKATAKHAYAEGWTMPRVVKSTVAELSGKGGEMVMDVVGRRDKAGIAEIETCDIEQFSGLAFGERSRWLWHGKPLKKINENDVGKPGRPSQLGYTEGLNAGLMFKADDKGGFEWTARKSIADGLTHTNSEPYDDLASPLLSREEATDDEGKGIKNKMKRAAGLGGPQKDDGAKATISKGAPGLLGKLPSKALHEGSPTSPTTERRPFFKRSQSSPLGSPTSANQSPSKLDSQDTASREQRNAAGHMADHNFTRLTTIMSGESNPTFNPPYGAIDASHTETPADEHFAGEETASDTASFTAPSTAGSMYNDIHLNDVLPTGPETEQDVGLLLKRTVSTTQLVDNHYRQRADDYYLRNLSFSLAEDAVLTWTSLITSNEGGQYNDVAAQSAQEDLLAIEAKHVRGAIQDLYAYSAPWTQEQLATLQTHFPDIELDQAMVDSLYYPHINDVQSLHTNSEMLFREQKDRLEEGSKEIDTLAAKLEYEIEGLRGRIADVEVGVQDFSRDLDRVEERATELEEVEKSAEQGWSCVMS